MNGLLQLHDLVLKLDRATQQRLDIAVDGRKLHDPDPTGCPGKQQQNSKS